MKSTLSQINEQGEETEKKLCNNEEKNTSDRILSTFTTRTTSTVESVKETVEDR